jgi:flavin-dependent dehydrogenase
VNDRRVIVRTEREGYTARVLAAADGANGIVGRSAGTSPNVDLAVALEGNVTLRGGVPSRWKGTVALDLGGLPGGYGWVFPKGDHLNVGVGAWRWFAPNLREHLPPFVAATVSRQMRCGTFAGTTCRFEDGARP